ncbi:phage tail assembly protein, partial [Serratia symbiotica]|nr:phage tail assembly protein [Serratia symbiotica]
MSKKNDNAITLAKPVVRGDEKITQVTITDEIKQAGS